MEIVKGILSLFNPPKKSKQRKNPLHQILLRVSERKLLFDGGYLDLPNGSSARILPFRPDTYQSKAVALGSFPKIRVPAFALPKTMDSNPRMKKEGERIIKDTVYFQGLK